MCWNSLTVAAIPSLLDLDTTLAMKAGLALACVYVCCAGGRGA
jgi:hypothetical protein